MLYGARQPAEPPLRGPCNFEGIQGFGASNVQSCSALVCGSGFHQNMLAARTLQDGFVHLRHPSPWLAGETKVMGVLCRTTCFACELGHVPQTFLWAPDPGKQKLTQGGHGGFAAKGLQSPQKKKAPNITGENGSQTSELAGSPLPILGAKRALGGQAGELSGNAPAGHHEGERHCSFFF